MYSKIDAAALAAFHDRALRNPDWPVFDEPRSGAWRWIAANHRYNGLRWREEARARRLDLPPAEVAASKRLGDRYDQKRQDAVDALDERLLGELDRVRRLPAARLSSQTAGAMIDRLSILALQLHHACHRAPAAPISSLTAVARWTRGAASVRPPSAPAWQSYQ